jgi:hypothetical protein
MKNTILVILFIFSTSVFGQSPKEKAHELAIEAIDLMESGEIEKSIELLEQAQDLDPSNIDIPYEMAYANYLGENFKESIKILKKLTKHKDVSDRIWQMLGNSYDMDGETENAIGAYEKGLKKFPNSGLLYVERGIMEMKKEDYNNAMSFFEKGIEKDPDFPSNYYWASRLYLSSTEEVWGMIYGEIFMNLERNSERTAFISKLLFDTYKSEIQFTNDTSISVSFSKNNTITLEDLSNPESFRLPFGVGVYEPTLLLSIVNEKSIDLESLHRIRSEFVKQYFKKNQDDTYPINIFFYQKRLADKGHLEAYNHWILMKGDEAGFGIWKENNQDKWNAFIDWFQDNPLVITEKNQFFTGQY